MIQLHSGLLLNLGSERWCVYPVGTPNVSVASAHPPSLDWAAVSYQDQTAAWWMLSPVQMSMRETEGNSGSWPVRISTLKTQALRIQSVWPMATEQGYFEFSMGLVLFTLGRFWFQKRKTVLSQVSQNPGSGLSAPIDCIFSSFQCPFLPSHKCHVSSPRSSVEPQNLLFYVCVPWTDEAVPRGCQYPYLQPPLLWWVS